MSARRLQKIFNNSKSNKPVKTLLLLVFLALLLSILPVVATQDESTARIPQLENQTAALFGNALAANHLEQAWKNTRDAGGYSFRTDLVQITIPLAQPSNIGLTSRKYTYHIEGSTSGLASSDPSGRTFKM